MAQVRRIVERMHNEAACQAGRNSAPAWTCVETAPAPLSANRAAKHTTGVRDANAGTDSAIVKFKRERGSPSLPFSKDW